MLVRNLLFLYQFWAFSQAIFLMPSSSSIKMDRFDGMCRSKKNVPIRTNFVIIKAEAVVIYLNATVHVSEDIPGNPLMYLKVRRCRSKENLDTCEDFLQARPTSFCDNLDESKFNPVNPHYTPKFVCPLTKGNYYAYNYKMDLSSVVIFPLGNYYWRASMETRDRATQRLLYCFNADGYLVRNH